jgi:hypothetical protein
MVMGKATKETEAGVLPDEKALAEMGKYSEELMKAGVVLDGAGLRASSLGKRVRFSDGKPLVTDGPFTETKELLAGFQIWNVKSMDEAVEWVKRSPVREGEVEIRPLFEAEDFGENLTPELREQAEHLRDEMRQRSGR